MFSVSEYVRKLAKQTPTFGDHPSLKGKVIIPTEEGGSLQIAAVLEDWTEDGIAALAAQNAEDGKTAISVKKEVGEKKGKKSPKQSLTLLNPEHAEAAVRADFAAARGEEVPDPEDGEETPRARRPRKTRENATAERSAEVTSNGTTH